MYEGGSCMKPLKKSSCTWDLTDQSQHKNHWRMMWITFTISSHCSFCPGVHVDVTLWQHPSNHCSIPSTQPHGNRTSWWQQPPPAGQFTSQPNKNCSERPGRAQERFLLLLPTSPMERWFDVPKVGSPLMQPNKIQAPCKTCPCLDGLKLLGF